MVRIVLLATLGGFVLLQGCARGAQSGPPSQSASSAKNGQTRLLAEAVSPCKAAELTLSFEGRDGDFTGMSHDGALLTLTNTSGTMCYVPRSPQLAFADAAGKPLALHMQVPPGMHPGPVVFPVQVAAGAKAQGKMRWVTGPVYDTNTCIDTAQVSLDLPGGTLKVPFKAHICGPSPQKLEYEQEWMQSGRDPKSAR